MITLEKALELSRAQFLDYARQHRAKNTPEAYAKAVVNDGMADMISEALSAHRARVEGDREAVARIVDPEAFNETHADDNEEAAAIFAEAWTEALAKADAILALVQQDHAPSVGGDGQYLGSSVANECSDGTLPVLNDTLHDAGVLAGVEKSIKRHLTDLKFSTTGKDPKNGGYAYAEVPDWALRQWLNRIEIAQHGLALSGSADVGGDGVPVHSSLPPDAQNPTSGPKP